MLSPPYLTLACLACVGVLLVVDHLGLTVWRVVAKLVASTCFVLVAVSLGAHQSGYGQLVLGALLLGWLGDALLLSRANAAFMAGLAAFLLAHLLFAAAFALGGVAVMPSLVALAVVLVVGYLVLRWLLPHTPPAFKKPVVLYVVVILGMCVVAAGHAFAAQRWSVLLGAVLFACSDLAVGRERFVQQGYVNRLWGWPTYFIAQLVLAWTVVYATGAA